MEAGDQKKKWRWTPFVLGIFVLITLTVLVLLQSSNVWKGLTVENASDTLLLYALSSLNFVALLIFGFIFLRSIIKLVRERRTFTLGAKIKTRLFLYFAAVSILPIIAMAVFSFLFWNRAIDRWFTNIPENVMREAKDVQTEGVAYQSAKLRDTSRMLASQISKDGADDEELKAIAVAGNLTFIELLSADNQTISSFEKPLPPNLKSELTANLSLLKRGELNDPGFADGNGFDLAFADLPNGRKLVIVPDYMAAGTLGQIVETSLVEFEEIKSTAVTIRRVGLLTIGLLTFLLIFASSWTAFYIARGLTVPIKALAEGADEIARGNLQHRVDVLAEDELALLVSAFNEMSGKLEENSAELRERRKYIETVLQSLPTGVISFDAENRVTTINKAAVNILKLENAHLAGIELEKIVSEVNLPVLERIMARANRTGHAADQTDLQSENAHSSAPEASIPVSLTATALPDKAGVVLVIEDLSELISAQRASAWQEVARRMAHEIKNPLTPIQLSAERILKRYFADTGANGEKPNGQMGRVIDESTATILREVDSLKSMVDEFSRFARLPNAQLENVNPNDIVRQAAALYEDRVQEVDIDLDLDPALPNSMADTEQLKRVFVNLIENAVEAFDKSQEQKKVVVHTRHDRARDIIVAEVSDNGNGIPPSDFQKLFQPYFSTKGRGTGLGLAIVRRIVSEHHGKINVVANTPRGAKFILELPVSS